MESKIGEKTEKTVGTISFFRWLPEAEYTLNNPEFEAMYQFSLSKTLARTNRFELTLILITRLIHQGQTLCREDLLFDSQCSTQHGGDTSSAFFTIIIIIIIIVIRNRTIQHTNVIGNDHNVVSRCCRISFNLRAARWRTGGGKAQTRLER